MADPVSERLFLGRITPGMDVCDVTGDKVGSIAHIYRYDEATEPNVAMHANDEIMEIKTGFLGLGHHYYVPVSAVQEVLTDSVFLSVSRESFDERGFSDKPEHFDRLH